MRILLILVVVVLGTITMSCESKSGQRAASREVSMKIPLSKVHSFYRIGTSICDLKIKSEVSGSYSSHIKGSMEQRKDTIYVYNITLLVQ